MLRRLRWPFECLGVLLAVFFFCLLPRAVAQWIGRRLGGLMYWCSPRSRHVALENLRLMLGMAGADARRLARASMRGAGAALIDMLRAPRVTRALVRRDLEIPEASWRVIDDIRRGRRGAVLACGHYGNWEFTNLSGPFGGMPPATVIVRPLPNPLLDRLIFALRSWTGQRLVTRGGAALDCMQWVRDGNVCAITFDLPVPPDSGAHPVGFFGLQTYTTVAIGYVAAMTRAPVYLCYCEPLGAMRHRLVLVGPLDAPLGDTLRETALATTRAVSQALEAAIRAAPQNWAWWLKRWKVRPDDAPRDLYPSYSVSATHHWPRGQEKRRDREKYDY